MTPEDFRTKRKDLGLSIVGLSIALGVGDHAGPNERTIRRWEKGKWPIPGMAVLAIMYLKKTNQKSSSTNLKKPSPAVVPPNPYPKG
jgi:DNA-binding transcriptional regulator YiaG